jgi:hypothetical protein
MVNVLQELMLQLRTAFELVSEISARFERGDAAEESVNRLVAQTKIIQRYVARAGDGLSCECRTELANLLAAVQSTLRSGNCWLARAAGPELALQTQRRRLSQAYGLSSRNN